MSESESEDATERTRLMSGSIMDNQSYKDNNGEVETPQSRPPDSHRSRATGVSVQQNDRVNKEFRSQWYQFGMW